MAYTIEFKIHALNYAKKVGSIPQAAKVFAVHSKTMYRWNEEYNICDVRPVREFNDEEKIQILEYANEHGLTSAMREFDVNIFTMLSWNRTLKIYRATGRRANATHVQKYEEVSTEKKLEILNFVKTHGMGQAQKKYNKASSTIQTWNAELGVYRPRTHRTFTPEQKDKIIQFADSTSIAEAAKQFHLYSHQIQRWIDDKKRTTEK